jgi:ParB family transcriptional regulator, chromosome partitioning protein
VSCRSWLSWAEPIRENHGQSGRLVVAAVNLSRASALDKCREAEVVRRDWLNQFLTRKTPPKDAARWIAVTLATGSHEVRRAMEDGHRLATQLLGLADTDTTWRPWSAAPHPIADAAATASPARATMLTLAVLLAGFEQATGRHIWRNPTGAIRSYFTALAEWGYPLSEVERQVVEPSDDHGQGEDPSSDIAQRSADAAEVSLDSDDAERDWPEPGDADQQ